MGSFEGKIGFSEGLRPYREMLPAQEVGNRVLWVNNAIEAPFRLEVGKSTVLGMFLVPGEVYAKKFQVEVLPRHHRSALLARIFLQDKEARVYRDIVIKGLGMIGSVFAEYFDKLKVGKAGRFLRVGREFGIQNKTDAEHNRDISEIFL